PVSTYIPAIYTEHNLNQLGQEAIALFDGQTDKVLAALVQAGSSGGARPKVQICCSSKNMNQCRTQAHPGDEAWLVKFTSQHLALGHEEGICEAVYLDLADKAQLHPPEWRLLLANGVKGAKS